MACAEQWMVRSARRLLGPVLATVILVLPCSSALAAEVHRDMRDLEFSWVVARTVTVEQRTIHYTLRHQRPTIDPGVAYPAPFVEQVMQSATRELFGYLGQEGIPISECSPSLHLDLYTIEYSVLNNHSRFADWGPENGVTDKTTFEVWALFDPMKYDRSTSSIMLTDHGSWANEILLAHETSHYWYDRLCLGLSVHGGTEAFAQSFQAHYERYMEARAP